MNLYGLVGYPLGHSFSKKYFTDKFEEEKLIYNQYELFPINAIEKVRELINSTPGLKGLNVTIPYKQSVLKYLDDITNIPGSLKACNCIKIVNGHTYGYNTDIIGFEKSILPKLKTFQKSALILGNGGAAEAVKYVFEKNRINFEVVSRILHAGSTMTYADITDDIIAKNLIIVNTTPLGMHPGINSYPQIPYHSVGSNHFFYDLVYNPETTVFLKKAKEQGAYAQNGHEMLVSQAEESWKIWNDD